MRSLAGRHAASAGAILALFGLSAASGATAEVAPHLQPYVRVPVPAPAQFAAAARADRPRLILTAERQAEIRRLCADSPVAQEWYRTVRANADLYHRAPPIAYVPEKPGERAQVIPMLHPGRAFVDRVLTLAFLAVQDRDERAMQRLRSELTHALETWPDWQYGLARYEIAAGLALAYDWLHARWTPEERGRLSGALRRLALEPYVVEFAGFSRPSERNTGIVRNNVNLVCNSGASVAALALIDEYPELAGDVLARAFALLQVALPGFGLDGAWVEGVGYWKFGVRHLVQYLAALQTACGTDFGLVSGPAFPGFAHTWLFPVAMTSPIGRTFDFADDAGGAFSSAALLWLGGTFNAPLAVAFERNAPTSPVRDAAVRGVGQESAREAVQRMLYFRPAAAVGGNERPPLDVVYPDAGIATLRSSWSDPKGTFVGLKAGSAAGNRHAHLDAGTVVIDALGERWLTEIGRGPYVTSYFNQERFLFFQARTEGHNTLLVGWDRNRGGNQALAGKARLRALESSPEAGACEIDLTELYPGATRVVRTVRLFAARSQVAITDAIELARPDRVRWHAYTPARSVSLAAEGRKIALGAKEGAVGGVGMRALLALESVDPAQRFVVEPAAPLAESEAINRETLAGFSRIAIESGKADKHEFRVLLSTRTDGAK